MIFVRQIQAAVAKHYGLPIETMWAKGLGANLRERSRPRQIAMCLSRRLTDHSTVLIGQRFKRDHSTVITGDRAAEKLCQADPAVAEVMRRLTLELVRG